VRARDRRDSWDMFCTTYIEEVFHPIHVILSYSIHLR